MNQSVIDIYWKPCFKTYYEAYFQEVTSESLSIRWQKIDVATAFLVAITASGSAIAGWALWNEIGWKIFWAILAGFASLLSILHGIMGVGNRIKVQEELRQLFSNLRVDLESLLLELPTGITVDMVKEQYEKLRDRYSECMRRTSRDIIFSKKYQHKLQEQLNNTLKEKGYKI